MGTETSSEYVAPTPATEATASAKNPTWESPSPIIEYLFKTRLTPSMDEHSDTSNPTTSARSTTVLRNSDANNSVIDMIYSSFE